MLWVIIRLGPSEQKQLAPGGLAHWDRDILYDELHTLWAGWTLLQRRLSLVWGRISSQVWDGDRILEELEDI